MKPVFLIIIFSILTCHAAKSSEYIPNLSTEQLGTCILSLNENRYDRKKYREKRLGIKQRDERVLETSPSLRPVSESGFLNRLILKKDLLSTFSFIDDEAYDTFVASNQNPSTFWYFSGSFYSLSDNGTKLNRNMFRKWSEETKAGSGPAGPL